MKSNGESFSMTPAEHTRKLMQALREEGQAFRGDPEKARAFLIRMGILDKSGKRLVKRYRH